MDSARPIRPKDFGRYRLTARLASGGMGTIYLAQVRDAPQQLVAVKRIHEHLTEQGKFVEMFYDEARIAARIDHANVCGVLDFGETDGTPFLAMPFLLGEPLSGILSRLRRRPPDEVWPFVVARLMADACQGLHAAHELRGSDGRPLQVVHRDVSPHNLLVGYDGMLRVLDFGVASARQKLASTATGEIRGKFSYMAPENLDAAGIDRRADIWSLGVVLWECISLDRLFRAESMMDTVNLVLTGPIPSLSEYRMDVPLGLEEIVFRALARDPGSRFQTADEMARELMAFLAEEDRIIGVPDIAEYMRQLFPDGKRQQSRLVMAATGVDVEQRPEPAPAYIEPVAEPDAEPAAPPHVALTEELEEVTTIDRQPPSFGDEETLQGRGVEPSGIIAWPAQRSWKMPALVVGLALAAGASAYALVRVQNAEPTLAEIDADAVEVEPAPEQVVEPADAGAERPEETRGPRTGRLRVTTRGGGWALLFNERGARIGKAPGIFRLRAGQRTVQVQAYGRGAKTKRRVTIRPGRRTRLRLRVRRRR